MSNGTPKTLMGAIENASERMAEVLPERELCSAEKLVIHAHVKDKLSQIFGALMFKYPEIEADLLKIFEEQIKE